MFQLQWNPSVAILVTLDFFLNTLNVSFAGNIKINLFKKLIWFSYMPYYV